MDDFQDRRRAIEAEIRATLGLPAWSNLRGDDVISIVQSLDTESRVRVNYLFVDLRELLDAADGRLAGS